MKYLCPKHNTEQEEACKGCMDIINSEVPESLEDRLAELRMWFFDIDILTVEFNDLHERIQKLMGRPVWTHELASPQDLIHELETNQRIGIEEIAQKAADYVGKDNVVFIEEPNAPEG